MNELPNEILNRIDALAAKLGTTVDHLWPEYVGLIRAEHIASAASVLIVGIMCGLCLLKYVPEIRVACKDEDGTDVVLGIFIGGLAASLVIAGMIFGLMRLLLSVAVIIYPEGAAIRELLGR